MAAAVIGGNDDFSNSRTGISRGAGSSVMEKIELERSGIKSGGLSSGISERHITHGSSIATGYVILKIYSSLTRNSSCSINDFKLSQIGCSNTSF
jgi:hypothetical protein